MRSLTSIASGSSRPSISRAERRLGPVQLISIVAAAALATQVKTWAESVLQPVAEKIYPPTSAGKERRGADPSGHPDNMPPTVLAEKITQQVGEQQVPDQAEEKAPQVLHWVMGIGLGTIYGLIAHRVPALRTSHGLLFGATAFATTHATALPALHLQDSPTHLPKAWWVWELGSHLVYGVAVDTGLRIGDTVAATVHRTAS